MDQQQQQQRLANNILQIPIKKPTYITLEQFMRYQNKQNENFVNFNKESIKNLLELLIPDYATKLANLANFTGGTHFLPTPEQKQNTSKQFPDVVVLSLDCNEPKTSGTSQFCSDFKAASEEALQMHLQEKHGVNKYRCLNLNCNSSFGRR